MDKGIGPYPKPGEADLAQNSCPVQCSRSVVTQEIDVFRNDGLVGTGVVVPITAWKGIYE